MNILPYQIIAYTSVILAIVVYFLRHKCNKQEEVFLYYIYANGFFELLAWVCSGYNNLPGLHLYTLVHFVVLLTFFARCLEKMKVNLPLKPILILGMILLISNSLFVQSLYSYNSYGKSLVELSVISLSVYLFVLFIKDSTHDRESMRPSVSFVSAIFLNSSVSFILYLYSNDILQMDTSLSYNIWYLKLAINYISMMMIMLGLSQIVMKRRRTKLYPS